jgi:putative transposase
MKDTAVRRSHLGAIGLTDAGQDYVAEVENSDPARKVGERRKRNVIFEVAMSRLKVVLQAESLSGEFLFLNGLDARTDVLAAFDQPTSRSLKIVDCNGKATTVAYTADYLAIFELEVCAFEIKADVELEALCALRPSDWVKSEDSYRYLPAERDFAELGIRHVVVPTSTLSAVLAANQRLLSRIRELTDSPKLRKMRSKMRSVVEYEESIRIGDLLDRLEETDATAVLQLIEQGQIFAPLDRTLLADPREVWVATTPTLARAADAADCYYQSALAHLTDSGSSRGCDPRYYGELARRYAFINGLAPPESTSSGPTKRRGTSASSLRRYKRALRESGGNSDAIEPGWGRCGNREIRISPTHQSYVIGLIREQRSDPDDQSVKAAFKNYKASFESFQEATELHHLKPISKKHFYHLSHSAPGRVADAARKGGRRLANATADPFDPTAKTLLATRPFEVAHIDHYKTDLHVVIGQVRGERITRRAWLTAMVDGFTKEVLALWLGFADPSKKSCSMVIRDCVRRHGKCPETIVVDSGSDFRSDHFEAMLAGLSVNRAERPVEDPRFGKEVERIFGILKEKCLRGLPGYGLDIQQARKLSAAFKAKANADLTLPELTRIICAFAFSGYNVLGFNSPADLRAEFARNFCTVGGKQVAWDRRFMILTAIEPPSSNYKLWTGRGIRVFDRWYTSSELSRYYGLKKDISVKIEPFNYSQIYVCIRGEWIVAWNAEIRHEHALAERRVLADASIKHDLRGLITELSNVADLEMAAIVETSRPVRVADAVAEDSRRVKGGSRGRVRRSGKTTRDADLPPGLSFTDVQAIELEPPTC